MAWATSVPILVFLGLSVLYVGPMYGTDGRQTDVRRASSLNAPYPRGGGIIITKLLLSLPLKDILNITQHLANLAGGYRYPLFGTDGTITIAIVIVIMTTRTGFNTAHTSSKAADVIKLLLLNNRRVTYHPMQNMAVPQPQPLRKMIRIRPTTKI